MQVTEIVFFLYVIVIILNPTINPMIKPLMSIKSKGKFIFIGYLLILVGITLEGFRWQLIPSYLVYVVITVVILKFPAMKMWIRNIGRVVAVMFLSISIFLSYQFPVFTLATPSGSYGVGTFNYMETDESRTERFSPKDKRNIYVQVWYPSDKSTSTDYPVRTFWQELYSGDYDLTSFLFGYLGQIDTHSHINSPIAKDKKFPGLLFNHGLFLITEQNTSLMEHLASNGYVVFSISRPYQGFKINFDDSPSIMMSDKVPMDVGNTQISSIDIINRLLTNEEQAIAMKELFALGLSFSNASNENEKRALVTQGLKSRQFQLLEPAITEESLYDSLTFLWHMNLSIDHWVKDTQFIIDNLESVKGPDGNFLSHLNTEGFGLFGMSFGGGATGEFCKIDDRCLAGINMDGLHFGDHWDSPLKSPFLVLTSVENTGMNDFAYLPSSKDYFDYTIKNTMHFDLLDAGLISPLFHNYFMEEDLDAVRVNEVINDVHLSFFDHYIKRKTNTIMSDPDIPELTIRQGKENVK
ncbi:MAG: hypothetical protein HRT54_22185 [Colwellia sp.]|nr:hypothetical protein [Colwellia sp.]